MDLMKELIKGASRPSGPDPWEIQDRSADQMLDELEENSKTLINKTCPFKVGDIVTPKKNRNNRGRGLPMKVMFVHDELKSTSNADGHPVKMFDMIAAVVLNGETVMFEHNSANFEKWDATKL